MMQYDRRMIKQKPNRKELQGVLKLIIKKIIKKWKLKLIIKKR